MYIFYSIKKILDVYYYFLVYYKEILTLNLPQILEKIKISLRQLNAYVSIIINIIRSKITTISVNMPSTSTRLKLNQQRNLLNRYKIKSTVID